MLPRLPVLPISFLAPPSPVRFVFPSSPARLERPFEPACSAASKDQPVMMNEEQGRAWAPAITLWQFITLYLLAQLTQAREIGTYQSFITTLARVPIPRCHLMHTHMHTHSHIHIHPFIYIFVRTFTDIFHSQLLIRTITAQMPNPNPNLNHILAPTLYVLILKIPSFPGNLP